MNNEWLVYFHRNGDTTYHLIWDIPKRSDWEFYALHRTTNVLEWMFDKTTKRWRKVCCL